MSTSTQRNTTIDLAKYIASLLIICIHTGLCTDLNQTLGFVIVEIISRLAVPFFAVSTGYFLTSRWGANNQKRNIKLLCVQEKKLIRLYAIWTAIYLFFSVPEWIRTGWLSPWAFVDYLIGSIRDGSHYHLWYILSLIYALPFFFILLPVIRKSCLVPVSAGLYTVMLLFYSYNWCLPDGGGRLFKLLSYSFPATAAVFLMLPMLLLGMVIGTRPVLPVKKAIGGLIISICPLCLEAFWLREMGQAKYSYIIFIYPTVYFLFMFLLNIRTDRKIFTKLAMISTFVYCFHPMVVETFRKVEQSSVFLFLITALISTLAGFGYIILKKKLERKGLCFH